MSTSRRPRLLWVPLVVTILLWQTVAQAPPAVSAADPAATQPSAIPASPTPSAADPAATQPSATPASPTPSAADPAATQPSATPASPTPPANTHQSTGGKGTMSPLAAGGAIIFNGTVQLGVNPTGNLDTPGGTPSSGEGTTDVGLRYMPTNAESTAPGCLCEGWGAADATTGVSGSADEAFGAPVNMTVENFTSTATTAVSTVTIGTTLRVTHDYHPSSKTSNLYEVAVTIENMTPSAVDLRYRRVMDWDIEPTAFSEYVTVSTGNGNSSLIYNNNDGFTQPNPLGPQTSGVPDVLPILTGSFTDQGPRDHGALFDFDFGNLPAHAFERFTIYYGAAATETGALGALSAVGAGVYSIAEPGTTAGRDDGTPNTFMFGFANLSPVEIQPLEPPEGCEGPHQRRHHHLRLRRQR